MLRQFVSLRLVLATEVLSWLQKPALPRLHGRLTTRIFAPVSVIFLSVHTSRDTGKFCFQVEILNLHVDFVTTGCHGVLQELSLQQELPSWVASWWQQYLRKLQWECLSWRQKIYFRLFQCWSVEEIDAQTFQCFDICTSISKWERRILNDTLSRWRSMCRDCQNLGDSIANAWAALLCDVNITHLVLHQTTGATSLQQL